MTAMTTIERFLSDPADRRHGSVNGYSNLKCRCERCREAWRISHNQYMNSHPEQLAKTRERSLQYRAARLGYSSRAEYDGATRIFRCPEFGCDWAKTVYPSWLARGNDGGYRRHWLAAHSIAVVIPAPTVDLPA